jgi:hypothetical protein
LRILEHGDADEASDMALAIQIGEALNRAYPNHPWTVGFQGRGLVIRHLSIASEVMRVIGREGFSSLLPRDKLGTPKEVSHTAIEFGGMLLEAFGLKRGAWDGSIPQVPSSWVRRKHKDFH